jgi:hypothetical protein
MEAEISSLLSLGALLRSKVPRSLLESGAVPAPSEISVMKEETTNGLTPQQLARLLAIGLQAQHGEGNPGNSRTPAEVLQDILDRELPLDPASPNSLASVLCWTSEEVLSAAGRTIRDLLLEPETHLVVIKTLKDYGKGLVRRAGPGAKETAATVIYYAAIANGLVFHGRKITRHSYRTLHEAYAELQRKALVPEELKDLFAKALAVCRRKG